MKITSKLNAEIEKKSLYTHTHTYIYITFSIHFYNPI